MLTVCTVTSYRLTPTALNLGANKERTYFSGPVNDLQTFTTGPSSRNLGELSLGLFGKFNKTEVVHERV